MKKKFVTNDKFYQKNKQKFDEFQKKFDEFKKKVKNIKSEFPQTKLSELDQLTDSIEEISKNFSDCKIKFENFKKQFDSDIKPSNKNKPNTASNLKRYIKGLNDKFQNFNLDIDEYKQKINDRKKLKKLVNKNYNREKIVNSQLSGEYNNGRYIQPLNLSVSKIDLSDQIRVSNSAEKINELIIIINLESKKNICIANVLKTKEKININLKLLENIEIKFNEINNKTKKQIKCMQKKIDEIKSFLSVRLDEINEKKFKLLENIYNESESFLNSHEKNLNPILNLKERMLKFTVLLMNANRNQLNKIETFKTKLIKYFYKYMKLKYKSKKFLSINYKKINNLGLKLKFIENNSEEFLQKDKNSNENEKIQKNYTLSIIKKLDSTNDENKILLKEILNKFIEIKNHLNTDKFRFGLFADIIKKITEEEQIEKNNNKNKCSDETILNNNDQNKKDHIDEIKYPIIIHNYCSIMFIFTFAFSSILLLTASNNPINISLQSTLLLICMIASVFSSVFYVIHVHKEKKSYSEFFLKKSVIFKEKFFTSQKFNHMVMFFSNIIFIVGMSLVSIRSLKNLNSHFMQDYRRIALNWQWEVSVLLLILSITCGVFFYRQRSSVLKVDQSETFSDNGNKIKNIKQKTMLLVLTLCCLSMGILMILNNILFKCNINSQYAHFYQQTIQHMKWVHSVDTSVTLMIGFIAVGSSIFLRDLLHKLILSRFFEDKLLNTQVFKQGSNIVLFSSFFGILLLISAISVHSKYSTDYQAHKYIRNGIMPILLSIGILLIAVCLIIDFLYPERNINQYHNQQMKRIPTFLNEKLDNDGIEIDKLFYKSCYVQNDHSLTLG